MEIILRIWQENRNFILQVGGALAVFLILKSCIVEGIIGAGAEKIREKNSATEREVVKTRTAVRQQYPEEKKALEELAAVEKDLAARYLTARPTDLPDPTRGSAQIQFNERIGKIWSDVQAKARERNVKIPEKITTSELGVTERPEDLERSQGCLDVLARALRSCVDAGMVQIDRVSIPGNDVGTPVADNDSFDFVYRTVSLTASGPFEAFKKVLRDFQSYGPPGFVQARLLNLDAKGAPGPNLLKGQIEFTGMFFEQNEEAAAPETETEPAKAAPPPKKPRATGVQPTGPKSRKRK